MQHTSDQALILQVDKFGDHDAIVHFFTETHGLNRGVVKGGLGSKRRAELQPASLVEAQWKSRLPEHLSSLTVDGAVSFGARVMHDPLRLAAVGSAMGLLGAVLAERDPHPELFHHSVDFLRHVAAGVEKLIWLSEYVRLELALLASAGFGLDLTQCAATGATDELIYVSPKSGRAVCRVAGAPYHGKMLALPAFLVPEMAAVIPSPPGGGLGWGLPQTPYSKSAPHLTSPQEGEGLQRQALPDALTAHLADSFTEIRDGLALTGHFIEARMLPDLHRKPPPLRAHFVALVGRFAG